MAVFKAKAAHGMRRNLAKTYVELMKTIIKPLLLSLALCGLFQNAHANDQMRDWTLASGEKKQGEILSFDEASRTATIRLSDGAVVKIIEGELSTIDRAWVLQWIEQDEEARELLKKIGGSVTEHAGTGTVKVDYAVYQPASVTKDSKPPMLILFHPGGNGRREIYRYIEAASKVGMTVVSLDYFKNNNKPSDDGVEIFKNLLPQITTTVPHDPKKIFMGGVSGGAARAYFYSALVSYPWAGIFANGGWLGGSDNYGLPFPSMRVAMVNGDKDEAANAYINADSEVLRKAGSTVTVHAFEGGHQLAPPSVQAKAFRWLLGQEELTEKIP